MILFGWVMEVVDEPGKKVWWTPFWFGCIAGAAPWIGGWADHLFGERVYVILSLTAKSALAGQIFINTPTV